MGHAGKHQLGVPPSQLNRIETAAEGDERLGQQPLSALADAFQRRRDQLVPVKR